MQGKVDGKRLKRVVLGEWEEYVGRLTEVEEGPERWAAVFDHVDVALPGEVDGLRQLLVKGWGYCARKMTTGCVRLFLMAEKIRFHH